MTVDLLLVGGGLANSLIAYRLTETRPEVDFVIMERGPSLGGHHTWSFHEHDLTPQQHRWMSPLVGHHWPRHEVRFPGRTRVLESGYSTISSRHLAAVLADRCGNRIRLGAEVSEVRPRAVILSDGSTVEAEAVIDGRGDPASPHLDVGFQKFLGRFVTTTDPHGLRHPILMDASVEQRGGYRFIYTLPLSDRSLLIEDTTYGDTPGLSRQAMRTDIDAYAEARGWKVDAVVDEEEGVLPIVLAGDIGRFWDDAPTAVPRSGMRAALFHPTTGYSLPEAVRMADDLAALDVIDGEPLYGWTRRRSEALWRRTGYFRLLNRMLYLAAEPHLRYRVLERFYGLGEPLIRRFYAGNLSWADRVRLLIGRPPVPIGRALGCVIERRRPERHRAGSATTREE